ncbi:spike base protein, RCAP_Rcc01079 family [Aquabacter sp. P-9]|uniref:spike base protein, RCAP_Rcc01079 family n=1 Tax=Aquabacter sediminis TaxID=3029197 RepID=UPI00237DBB81|nr:hypothetical protein [Aquabacter sp. P-9]MDE1567578.1 hypothetical protein [Aquabacter sp. P-9]
MPYDAARDPLRALSPSASSPARALRLVSPSDSADLDPYAKGVWVYVPGDVSGGFATIRVTAVGAASDTDTVDVRATPGLQPLPPVQVRRIWATGTSTGLFFYALADR